MSLFSKLFRKENKEVEKIDLERLPQHIAIIMDGNGRWAKSRGLPRNAGHTEGSKTLKKIVEYAEKVGIKNLTVYAFSTENWKRPKSEVDALMSLLLEYLRRAETELAGKTAKIKIIGDIDGLPIEVRQEAYKVMEMTQGNTALTLNIALNYGGRQEIISAVQKIAKDVEKDILQPMDITPELFEKNLFTYPCPSPDLVIRTSGEQRISNFLLWQCAYSEYYFTDVYWPDFSEKMFEKAIISFQQRNRRFGGV